MPPGSEGCCGPVKSREMGLRPLVFPVGTHVGSFPAPSHTTKLVGLRISGKIVLDEFASTTQSGAHAKPTGQRARLHVQLCIPCLASAASSLCMPGSSVPTARAWLALQNQTSPLLPTGDATESADDIFFRKAKEGMGADEAQFSVEMPLTGKAYLWADKYRPRKPRFFNRVHTGFEWNKYNQTHYDFDNPPPKIVQGYKFNIFYPDLIDKRSTPEYFLEACQDNKDFAILRFHAGPPYEDIAFKIVNREWEYSHRHGFRCQFANGIFQLWFHFKRYRYRR